MSSMRDYDDSDDPRFGFGLTEFQVKRLQKILTRIKGEEVSLAEAWGRACEMLAMAHAMMEWLAKNDGPVRPVTVEDLPSYQPRQRAA